MPLNAKGKKIMNALKKQYGDKAEDVFYAMKQKKKISGVETIGKDMGKRPAKKKDSVKKKARRV
jgi:hypothetical protein